MYGKQHIFFTETIIILKITLRMFCGILDVNWARGVHPLNLKSILLYTSVRVYCFVKVILLSYPSCWFRSMLKYLNAWQIKKRFCLLWLWRAQRNRMSDHNRVFVDYVQAEEKSRQMKEFRELCARRAPMFWIPLRAHCVWERMSVTLACTVMGTPRPSVQW